MAGGDFSVTAGWGHFGQGEAVMPGRGSALQRAYTPDERAALDGALPLLGASTFDVYLNDRAYWRNVPAAVWNYQLGGYQVLKKWLSYREQGCARAGAVRGGSAALHGHGAADCGATAAGGGEVSGV